MSIESREPLEGFWQSTIDSLSAHIAILDGEGKILAVNAAWRRFSSNNDGAEENTCTGLNYLRVCEAASGKDGEEGPRAAMAIRQVLTGVRREVEVPYPCHSPVKQRWFIMRVTRFEGPGPARVVVAHENITAPKAAQLRASRYAKQLERANAQLIAAEALESDSNQVLELIARNELIGTVLDRISKMLERQHPGCVSSFVLARGGVRPEVYSPRGTPEWFRETLEGQAADALAGCDGPGAELCLLAEALDREPSRNIRYFPFRTQQGTLAGCLALTLPEWPESSAYASVWRRAAALAGVATDHAEAYEKLSFQAHHDALTELPNRLLLQERLQQALARRRGPDEKFAVLMIDLDRFKQINDAYGHRTGDALLRQVGRRLLACTRPQDTVARIGGDEFVVLLEDIDSRQAVAPLAESISQAFHAPFELPDRQLLLSCSIGAGIYPDDAADAAALIRNADTALYRAKADGRSNWKLFDSGMGAMALERLQIELHLRNALARNELCLHYQPQTDKSKKLIGVEALMRWESPVLGNVSPGKFIPVAEESGLIVELGHWALLQACQQSVAWQRAGYAPVRLAVNVSTLQLVRSDFAERVASILEETGLEPGLLELEITESAMIHSFDKALCELEKVRQQGVRISIDDFGTGYSSLSYLQNLPVDSVKIDRSFIQELDRSSRNASSVVQAIIALAHNLKLEVVAEGVETEAQFRTLNTLECDITQGYHLHRPMNVDSVRQLLPTTDEVSLSVSAC